MIIRILPDALRSPTANLVCNFGAVQMWKVVFKNGFGLLNLLGKLLNFLDSSFEIGIVVSFKLYALSVLYTHPIVCMTFGL